MNQPEHEEEKMGQREQPEALSPREVIKKWSREAWKASGKRQSVLSELLGMPSTWLGMRISTANSAVLSLDMLQKLASIARYELPREVIEARKALDERRDHAQARTSQIWDQDSLPPESESVEDELKGLIELAHQHVRGGTTDRLNAFMRQRFGLDGSSGAILAEVGDAFGVTRERV